MLLRLRSLTGSCTPNGEPLVEIFLEMCSEWEENEREVGQNWLGNVQRQLGKERVRLGLGVIRYPIWRSNAITVPEYMTHPVIHTWNINEMTFVMETLMGPGLSHIPDLVQLLRHACTSTFIIGRLLCLTNEQNALSGRNCDRSGKCLSITSTK